MGKRRGSGGGGGKGSDARALDADLTRGELFKMWSGDVEVLEEIVGA